MKKILLFISTAAFMPQLLPAQLTNDWASTYTSTCASRGNCVTMHSNNDVVAAGIFNGTADFDPGSGTANLATAGTFGPTDMYIQKINFPNSTFMWAKRIRGTGEEIPCHLAHDATHLYVVGYFSATAQFDPAFVVPPITSAGSYDVFVAKYDANGNFVWANKFGSTGSDKGFGISLDASGNIVVCGEFTGTVNFDPAGVATPLTSAGSTDAFIATYTSAGAYVSAWKYGSTYDEHAYNITVNSSGDYVACGSYGNGAVGALDAYVTQFTSAGALSWVRPFGTGNIDESYDVVTDASDNVYFTGGLGIGTSTDLDPLTAGTTSITNAGTTAGSMDIFMISYSSAAAFNWAVDLPGNDNDFGVSIDEDPAGYIWVSGPFRDKVDFDPAGGPAYGTSAGLSDIFLLRYTFAGAYNNVDTIGNTGNDGPKGIFVNPVIGKLFVVGQFNGTVDFDPSAGTNSKTAAAAGSNFFSSYDWAGLPPRLAAPGTVATTPLNPFPNPSAGNFYLDNLVEGSVAEVFTPEGKKCGSWQVNTTYLELQLGKLENGIYLLSVTKPDGSVTTDRIAIQR